jgi:hypothetical protein
VKGAAIHPKFGFFRIERLEVRKSHDVIPVGMGEDEVELAAFFFEELIAETADAGSGIDNDDVTALGSNFDAGGVSAVLEVGFP